MALAFTTNAKFYTQLSSAQLRSDTAPAKLRQSLPICTPRLWVASSVSLALWPWMHGCVCQVFRRWELRPRLSCAEQVDYSSLTREKAGIPGMRYFKHTRGGNLETDEYPSSPFLEGFVLPISARNQSLTREGVVVVGEILPYEPGSQLQTSTQV